MGSNPTGPQGRALASKQAANTVALSVPSLLPS